MLILRARGFALPANKELEPMLRFEECRKNGRGRARGRVVLPVLVAVFACAWAAVPVAAETVAPYAPLGVYLTWQQDPTTTMTVHWHSFEADARENTVEYRRMDGEAWTSQDGSSTEFRFSEPQRLIHTVEITGLEPGETYAFRLGEDSPVYTFRTMPDNLEQPIRFATGGDLNPFMEDFGKMNKAVARLSPDFVVWGGDLSYANADPRRIDRWYSFFEVATETLVTPDGRLIPMVVGIGNHEIFNAEREDVQELNEEWGLAHREATWYHDLFAFPGRPTYGVLDFADYLSLLILDTGHVEPIDGGQTEWLDKTLAARGDVPHVFPVYHVPAYPSFRPFHFDENVMIRANWVPLFEEHGLRLAFENHDHTYKRTHPLKGGEIHPDGVVYLGDGAWGVGPREPSVREGTETWYLVDARSINHAYVVTLYEDQRHALAVDNEGNVFDELYQRLN